jgi:hypothetical protein
MTTAAEIRKRLEELAPYQSKGDVTALGIARQQAMEAQIAWARIMDTSHPISMTDIAIVHGCFATAVLLVTLAGADRAKADNLAMEIRDAWEGGGPVGEWIWEIHGHNAQEIAGLAAKLAELTETGPDGHVREKAGT